MKRPVHRNGREMGINPLRFHRIPFLTAILIGICATVTVAAWSLNARFAQGGQTREKVKEREVKIKIFKNQPVEIVAVKIKGASVEPDRKFAGDSDWFNGLTVTIKNVCDRPIVFATVLVSAHHEKDGVRMQTSDGRDYIAGVDLMYGVRPLMPSEPPRSYSATPLMPGQTADLVLSERLRDSLYFMLRERDSSTDIPELTLRLYQVYFEGDDDTKWNHGFLFRRDPNDPMNWLVIDPPPPSRNHAARKSKFAARMPPNLTPVSNHPLDPLPTCTYRDIGDVPKLCNARDNGGLFCVWQDTVLLTSGTKNAVAGEVFPKRCDGADDQHFCTV
jgi:hypothetical protein